MTVILITLSIVAILLLNGNFSSIQARSLVDFITSEPYITEFHTCYSSSCLSRIHSSIYSRSEEEYNMYHLVLQDKYCITFRSSLHHCTKVLLCQNSYIIYHFNHCYVLLFMLTITFKIHFKLYNKEMNK